jgi:gallate dioxygenase
VSPPGPASGRSVRASAVNGDCLSGIELLSAKNHYASSIAEIVGGFGVPHNPHFPLWVADGAPAAAEIERMYGGVAEQLRHVRPDVLIVFTADHYNMFFETCVPIFAIGVAESAAGASDYPQLPRRVVPIAADLARRLHGHAVHAGFDVGMSQELELDHTIIAPLGFLFADDVPPIVPVFVNGLIPPLPSARRCLALGRAIADAVRAAPEPLRVAVVASGSFSLEIGGPRISETSHTGVPAPEWVDRVMALLGEGAVAQLVDEATEERLAHAGNAGGELLEWIAMLGTIAPSRPAFLDVQPAFGHAYAAWPAP